MPKRESNISILLKSNRSKIVEAAIKSNFLELLKENESQAFNSFLCNIYTGTFSSKEKKHLYISNLKLLWNKNKEHLTKEIDQLKTQKNPESPQKTLSVEQIDNRIHRKNDYSPVKQKKNMERVSSIPGNQAKVVDEIKSMQNNYNKLKKCELFEDQSNLNNLNEKEESTKASRTSKTNSIKQIEMVNDFNNFYNTYHSSESLASKFESENETLGINRNSFLSSNSAENSEFRALRTIEKRKVWAVDKAKVKNIFNFKSHNMENCWSNILYHDYISTHNPYCVLVFKNRHVKKQHSFKKNLPLFRAVAVCKHSSCNTNHVFTMREK